MAARLKVGDNKAATIFRNLYTSDKGSFENDAHLAMKEWLLLGLWESLSKETLTTFKMRLRRISIKCWPRGLEKDGNLTWLHHNHEAFSGNVPMWAEWEWPKGKSMEAFRIHFYCLLIGQHPAGGRDASCSNLLCSDNKDGPIYDHHFFKCVEYIKNRYCFRSAVERIYNEYAAVGNCGIPRSIINGILERPCGMWVGLFDRGLFDIGLKLRSAHELHRIVTLASILSWGRFYAVP